MEEIKSQEEHHNLMRLADAQAHFIRKYSPQLPDAFRNDFERESLYLIQLAYREAIVPLTKHLTDVIMMQNRPIILEKL